MSEFARFRPCSPLISALLACALLATAACGSAPPASATSTASHEQATATPGNAQPTPAQLAAEWRAGTFKVDSTTVIYWEDPVSGTKYDGTLLNPPAPNVQIGHQVGDEPIQLPIIGAYTLTNGDFALLAGLPGGHIEQIDIGSDNLRYPNPGRDPDAGQLILFNWVTMPDGFFDTTQTNSPYKLHRSVYVNALERWFATHPNRAVDVTLFLFFVPLGSDSLLYPTPYGQLYNGSVQAREQFYEYLAEEGPPPTSIDNVSATLTPPAIPFVDEIATTSAFAVSLGYTQG